MGVVAHMWVLRHLTIWGEKNQFIIFENVDFWKKEKVDVFKMGKGAHYKMGRSHDMPKYYELGDVGLIFIKKLC